MFLTTWLKVESFGTLLVLPDVKLRVFLLLPLLYLYIYLVTQTKADVGEIYGNFEQKAFSSSAKLIPSHSIFCSIND